MEKCEICGGILGCAYCASNQQEESKSASMTGLCCVPIREEQHGALEMIYFQIGMEVKPSDRRDTLLRAANILNDFLKGRG